MKKSTENEEKKLTISDITEAVAMEMCEKYCRFPYEYKEDDYDQMIDEWCSNCPLNQLQ